LTLIPLAILGFLTSVISIQTLERRGFSTQYKKEKLLSAGGFGSVYKGIDTLTGSVVAIKCPLEGSDAELFNELKYLSKLNNTNIVQVIDAFYAPNGMLNIVEEFAPGGDLGDLIYSKPRFQQLSNPDRRQIFMEILGAVKYLHDNGICHRDLKPKNFIVTSKSLKKRGWNTGFHKKSKKPQPILVPKKAPIHRPKSDPFPNKRTILPTNSMVKLVDFGLADRNMDKFFSGGTSTHLSPENIKKPVKYKVDCRESDVFALGIILAELYQGYNPFQPHGENKARVRARIVKGKAVLSLKNEPLIKELVKMMLQKVGSSRPSVNQVILYLSGKF